MNTPKKQQPLVTTHKPGKGTGFAIGVSQEHYWVITALAKAHGVNRMAMLGEVIEQYAMQHLAQVEKK